MLCIISVQWAAVTYAEFIDLDFASQTLEIKTDSEAGSNDLLNVVFYQSPATGLHPFPSWFQIKFTNPMTYHVAPCMSHRPTWSAADLPSEIAKVWRIEIRETALLMYCNGRLVVNYSFPDSCKDKYSNLKKFVFWQPGGAWDDTASDEYKAAPITGW